MTRVIPENFITFYMCFIYQISTSPQYSYSQQAIDFIYDEIKKAPNKILDDLKEKIVKK